MHLFLFVYFMSIKQIAPPSVMSTDPESVDFVLLLPEHHSSPAFTCPGPWTDVTLTVSQRGMVALCVFVCVFPSACFLPPLFHWPNPVCVGR